MCLDDRNKAKAEQRGAASQGPGGEQRRQEAERSLAQAIKAADTFFTRVSESKLLDKPGLQPCAKNFARGPKHYQELFNKKKDTQASRRNSPPATCAW